MNTIREFIQSEIIIGEGKIGKHVLYHEYVVMFPDVQITIEDFIDGVKKEGIVYKHDIRFNSVRGCFINIQFNNNRYINKTNIGQFVQSKILKIDGNRIGKNQLFTKFKEMFPGCRGDVKEFVIYIKNEDIEYSHDMRLNYVRGCFLNIQFNDIVE